MLFKTLRPTLFKLDPEAAHHAAILGLRLTSKLLRRGSPQREPWFHPSLDQRYWGLRFRNPIGLAAGFDKNAQAAHAWPWMGFGFAELGTITRHAQPGNEQPRLFRLPEEEALINRLGFNNLGADQIAKRLRKELRPRPTIPIGINIGKSKITDLRDATEDYVYSFRKLYGCASYFCVNVSSPNTQGLRELQQESNLRSILTSIKFENRRLAEQLKSPPKPVLVKIAPELTTDQVSRICGIVLAGHAQGIVVSNTTLQRPGLDRESLPEGGLSGRPLRQLSTEMIRTVRHHVGDRIPIVGVGGVFTANDAYEKLRAGACLLQLYTALIYRGPSIAPQINRELVQRLEKDGFQHIREVIGIDA